MCEIRDCFKLLETLIFPRRCVAFLGFIGKTEVSFSGASNASVSMRTTRAKPLIP